MTPPERVRVTGPPRRHSTGRTTRGREIDDETPLGAILLRSLLREQGRLAVGVLLALVIGLGSLPLLFHLAPGLADFRVFGVPLPWLLIGVLVYPFLFLLGWVYVRRAEANERDFTDLVDEVNR